MSSSRLPERSWSLAARLTAWNVGSAFLLVLGVSGALYAALIHHLDREDDAFVTDRVRLLRALQNRRRGRPPLAEAIAGIVEQ